MLKKFIILLTVAAALTMAGCGGGGSSSTTSNDSGDNASDIDVAVYYPENLTVTSPLESGSGGVSVAGSRAIDISDQLNTITTMLSAGTIAACAFDPAEFLQSEGNASCYGPSIDYMNHPDSAGGTQDGSLAGGDLGIWLPVEGSNEACSAVQMNSRMDGISSKSQAAFTAMASMICVDVLGGYGIPSDTTNDILDDMNDMATATSMDVVFETATIAHVTVSGQNQFTYTLNFTFEDNSIDYPIEMIVTHISDDTGDYQGRFQYKYAFDTTDINGTNCPDDGTTAELAIAGSVLYARTGSDFAIDARYAQFCSNDAVGFVNGIVDPTDKFDEFNPTDNPDGWGDNFNRFVADFDEDTYLGNYTYAWQAGAGDSNTRVLNVSVTEDNVNSTLAGEAWFGYGSSIDTANYDNGIGGFICNWMGPNNVHNYSNYVQYQSLLQDTVTGVFEPQVNHIAYAPVNSCVDNDNDFYYDTDADNDMTDENGTDNLATDLSAFADYIAAFTVPTAPSNF